MGAELSRSFKPATMRLFVKLDEDGKYHEVENVSEVHISEEGDWCTNFIGTITLRGVDLHTSDGAYNIDKEHIKPPKSSLDTISADSPIFYAGSPICFKPFSKRYRYREHLPKKVTVNGDFVTCVWKDGTHTITKCHEGDEFDLNAAILVCAIKKWLPGGTYWYDASEDVKVDDVQKRRKKKALPEARFKRPDGLEPVGHATIERHPSRPYMRGGKYGDDEKLKVIEAIEGGMSQADASRKFGLSQGTVSRWMSEWRGKNGID